MNTERESEKSSKVVLPVRSLLMDFSSVFRRWVITTDNDKMSMRDSTQTVDYEWSQRKKADWNVISGGTNSMDFDIDDKREALSPSEVFFRKGFQGDSFT